MTRNSILCYCRAGFEADLSTEMTEKAAAIGVFGYPSFSKSSGFIEYMLHSEDDAQRLADNLAIEQLIFARQMFRCRGQVELQNSHDRISPIISLMTDFPVGGEVRVEYPDTTDGRELSKLCRKLTVPLRQNLRKQGLLSQKPNPKKPCFFVFFATNSLVFVGHAEVQRISQQPLGIMRLRFPSAAPSRSTLKLDEAIQSFIPAQQMEARFQPGMQAVDLGACPGGWTYQLVQRGLFVQAIDNGSMDEQLMESGLVSYYAQDGFKYEPRKKNVHWLVCDMIEQPQRVAKLMASWLVKGWCKETIFNLKLPMKQRYETVKLAQQEIDKIMGKHHCSYQLQAKHLYHDREEITVHIRLL